MAWTQFMDMSSGGTTKMPPYKHIYIEAPESKAVNIFLERFGHDPLEVSTCSCCGESYSVLEDDDFGSATNYERGRHHVSLEDYVKREDVLVLSAEELSR